MNIAPGKTPLIPTSRMTSRAPIMPPPNETEHSVSRVTREGKKLTYKLSVMQQPERARACGAGAKCESGFEVRENAVFAYNCQQLLPIAVQLTLHLLLSYASSNPTLPMMPSKPTSPSHTTLISSFTQHLTPHVRSPMVGSPDPHRVLS